MTRITHSSFHLCSRKTDCLKFLFAIFIFLLAVAFPTVAQEKPHLQQTTLWNRLVIQHRKTSYTYGLLLETRNYLNPFRHHITVAEVNIKKHLPSRISLGVHGGYILFTLPHDPYEKENAFQLHEIRFGQSITFPIAETKGLQLKGRFMVEERFFNSESPSDTESGYAFEYLRLRTRVSIKKQLSNRLDLLITEMFMLQSSGDMNFRFDQNRLDTFLRFHLSPKIGLDAGYLRWYQHKPNTIYTRHSIRTGMLLRL